MSRGGGIGISALPPRRIRRIHSLSFEGPLIGGFIANFLCICIATILAPSLDALSHPYSRNPSKGSPGGIVTRNFGIVGGRDVEDVWCVPRRLGVEVARRCLMSGSMPISSLRLRGGFERKRLVTYEGMLEKLESSDGGNLLWKKVRLVLSDSFLRVFAAGATNAEMDHPDEQLGVVQLERAEFSPADSARFWGEKKTVWSAFPNRSMIEIRFNGTTALLAAETAEERNKWLLTLYQNRAILGSRLLLGSKGAKRRLDVPHPASWSKAGRVMSAAMRWFDSAGVGMISCGLSCFRAMPAKKPATAEPRMMPGAASEASNAAAALHKTSTHAVSLLGGGAILGAFDVREVDNPTNETRRAGTATSPEADDREGLSPWRGSSKAPSPKKTASPQQGEGEVEASGQEAPGSDEAFGGVEAGGHDGNETVVVHATEEHTATCIWLHSIGDTGEMHAELPESLGVPWCKFVFPTAFERPVTLHHGIEQPSWFDITSIDGVKGVVQDEAGVRESARRILELVEAEIEEGIRPDRIVLAGFGQGGAVALSGALRCKHRLAGVVALSSWLAEGKDSTDMVVSTTKVGMPALLCHGNADVFIPPKLGRLAKDYLNSLGMQTAFKGYDMMGHAFCPRELVDVHKFMLQVLPRNDSMPELPSWIETTVTIEVAGVMGMKKRKTRNLVISDGSLQLFTIGQGTLLDSYDLLEFVAHAAVRRGEDNSIALTRKTVLDPSDEAGDEEALFSFASEAERDMWLVAIGRWQQLLIVRACNAGGSFRTKDLAKDAVTGRRSSIIGGLVRGIGKLVWRSAYGYPTEGKRSKGPGWENLVFSGGGIKGLVHSAALGVIADAYGDDGRDLKWVKRVAGVSAGTFAAVLVACGLSVEQVQEQAANLPLSRITEGMSTIQGVRNMLGQYGAYDGTALAEVVNDLINEWTGLQYATFQELHAYSGILLKVFATSVRNGALIEFSTEKTPHDQIGRACQSSMAVPFLFQAVPTSDGDLLVDGGVMDNCPLWCFDEVPGVRNPKTLGFWISSCDEGQPQTAANLREFAMRMVELILYVEQHRAIDKEKQSEVIWIQAPDISLSTFEISGEDKRQMYECGAGAAARFLRSYKVWEAKYGTWPSPGALAKELEKTACQAVSETMTGGARRSTSAKVMRWLARETGGARHDKIKHFVRSWTTSRRRLTRLIRDSLGPKQEGAPHKSVNPWKQDTKDILRVKSIMRELDDLKPMMPLPPGC